MEITVKLTEREADELMSSCCSMHGRLLRDKHVSQEERDFWWRLLDKITMAKVRAT